jgi:hypothetical protein
VMITKISSSSVAVKASSFMSSYTLVQCSMRVVYGVSLSFFTMYNRFVKSL